MNAAARIAGLYAAFAAFATLANLGAQALAIAFYRGPFAVEASILVGTAVGLPVKYLLDQRYIFGYRPESLAQGGQRFTLYTLTGVFTTALFWGTEYVFHVAFGTDVMRYVGGALGLAAGYVIKYRLDKRYVFVPRAPATAGCG